MTIVDWKNWSVAGSSTQLVHNWRRIGTEELRMRHGSSFSEDFVGHWDSTCHPWRRLLWVLALLLRLVWLLHGMARELQFPCSLGTFDWLNTVTLNWKLRSWCGELISCKRVAIPTAWLMLKLPVYRRHWSPSADMRYSGMVCEFPFFLSIRIVSIRASFCKSWVLNLRQFRIRVCIFRDLTYVKYFAQETYVEDGVHLLL